MPYPAFPKFTRKPHGTVTPKCDVCGSRAAYRLQCEPASYDPEPFDLCHAHARQCGFVDEIPGRLVTSFDGLPMSTAQHDSHVIAFIDWPASAAALAA